MPVEVGDRARGEFVVAVDLGQERREVREAVQTAAGVSLAVLLIASALAWVIAGRVLAPLRTLRTTAQGITESDLTRRIEVHGDDEIAELGRTFNAMLDRLEGAFASQRAFVSTPATSCARRSRSCAATSSCSATIRASARRPSRW